MTYGPCRVEDNAVFECDVLVIGSGAGGSSVVDVLTAAGRDVLMLEEGPYVDYRNAPLTPMESMSRLWRCGGMTAGLGPTPVSYAEGKCVGGGTEINSAIFQRAPSELLEEWAKRYDIDEFNGERLKVYYDRVAVAVNASITSGEAGAPSEILKRGSEALGWKAQALERGQRLCVGTNKCALGCPTGGKQSMTSTLIPQALNRGLRLVAECRVTRLLRKGRRMTGVKAVARGYDSRFHKVNVRANHVFLCAGAVHTPALLKRSGFSFNIGNTLRMHPTIKLVARFDEEINAQSVRLPLYAVTEFMPEQRLGGSIFSPGFFGMSLAEDWPHRVHLLKRWRNCGIYYAMIRGRGTGVIRPVPGSTEPYVSYHLTKEDWRNLEVSIGRLGRAMFAAGAKQVFPSIAEHPGWSSPDDCDEYLNNRLPRNRTLLMTIHIFSSCPPGKHRALCATDSFGRLYDVDNAIVADASQIPEAPGVNPQATIMVLAYRNTEAFLERAAAGNA